MTQNTDPHLNQDAQKRWKLMTPLQCALGSLEEISRPLDTLIIHISVVGWLYPPSKIGWLVGSAKFESNPSVC